MENKGIEIVTLTKVEGANLNSNGTEGVISVLKKVRDPVDMEEYVRVSGQSVKYQLRRILEEMGEPVSQIISKKESGEKVIVSAAKPEEYVDDDLFGYMVAKKENNKNVTKLRTAPVRTNGLISLFPYQEDRDFGVRYDPDGDQHNIHETEIATNIMRGNFFIEVDRVGNFTEREVVMENVVIMKGEERERRIKSFIEALMMYYGGAHLSRFFTKTYPEAIIVTFLNRKIPIVGDNFRIKQKYDDGKYRMDCSLVEEVLETFDEYLNKAYIGILESKFANLEEIKGLSNDKIQILPLKELKEKIKEENIL